MTDTASSRPRTDSEIRTHERSHTPLPERKARGMSHVDPCEASPQVRKSQSPEVKSRAPLPRDVTFSGLSIGRPERDTERGEINKTPTAEDGPEPIGAIAERVLTDLAPDHHHRDAIRRLARAHTTSPLYRKEPS